MGSTEERTGGRAVATPPAGDLDGDDITIVADSPRSPRRWIWVAVAAAVAVVVAAVVIIATRGGDDTSAVTTQPIVNAPAPDAPASKAASAAAARAKAAKAKADRAKTTPGATTKPGPPAVVKPGPDGSIGAQPPADARGGGSPTDANNPSGAQNTGGSSTHQTAPPTTVQKASASALQWVVPAEMVIRRGAVVTLAVSAHNPTGAVIQLPHPISCTPKLDHSEMCPQMIQYVGPGQTVGATYEIDARTAKPGKYTLLIAGVKSVDVQVTP